MIVLGPREVTLNEDEQKAREMFERMLDRGLGIGRAGALTHTVYRLRCTDPLFWSWLDGTIPFAEINDDSAI